MNLLAYITHRARLPESPDWTPPLSGATPFLLSRNKHHLTSLSIMVDVPSAGYLQEWAYWKRERRKPLSLDSLGSTSPPVRHELSVQPQSALPTEGCIEKVQKHDSICNISLWWPGVIVEDMLFQTTGKGGPSPPRKILFAGNHDMKSRLPQWDSILCPCARIRGIRSCCVSNQASLGVSNLGPPAAVLYRSMAAMAHAARWGNKFAGYSTYHSDQYLQPLSQCHKTNVLASMAHKVGGDAAWPPTIFRGASIRQWPPHLRVEREACALMFSLFSTLISPSTRFYGRPSTS